MNHCTAAFSCEWRCLEDGLTSEPFETLRVSNCSSGAIHDPSWTCLEVMVSNFMEEMDAESTQEKVLQILPSQNPADAAQCPTFRCKNDFGGMNAGEIEDSRVSELVNSIQVKSTKPLVIPFRTCRSVLDVNLAIYQADCCFCAEPRNPKQRR